MRICLQSMTKLLPAILIAAMAVSAQAQESSRAGSLTSSSRTEVQSSRQRASFPNLEVAAAEFEKELEPSFVVHVATANMPAFDNSTSPRRLSPNINSAAFQPPGVETAPAVGTTPVEQEGTFIRDLQAENVWTPDTHSFSPSAATFDGTLSPDSRPFADMSYANRSQYGRGAIALGSGSTFQKSNYESGYSRNPFPVGPDDCCDEWASFCGDCSSDACGCVGLKAKPGHFGLKWLKGKDACEKTPSRDRCNRGCKSCSDACESDCGCSEDSGRSGVIKAHCTNKSNRKSSCGCSDCQSGVGLFNR